MITEIEVEGLGVLRHLNNFQMLRVKRISDKRKRSTAIVAFGLGMTVRQFDALTTEQQRVAWEAHNRLYAPVSVQPDRSAPAPQRLPRPYERVSQDRAAQLGADLLRIRSELPRGHFRRWVEDKSGISYIQAQRFIRAAKASEAA